MNGQARAPGRDFPSDGPPAPHRLAAALPLLLVLALALALPLAATLTPPTAADRVERIARGVRCPVCEGESVAESDSQAALRIRAEIASEVAAGWTDEAIVRRLAAEYGDWILLTPPRRGPAAIAWLVPALALLAGLAALSLWLRRRARSASALLPPPASGGAAEGQEAPTAEGDVPARPLPARLRDFI
ncbi:MAG: cytochrome c-type biogenesis protein CcmH [Clostridia bacterium]|nr:cytochrome c-type biogenesis protein CcmH [Clostridia bacterium]